MLGLPQEHGSKPPGKDLSLLLFFKSYLIIYF